MTLVATPIGSTHIAGQRRTYTTVASTAQITTPRSQRPGERQGRLMRRPAAPKKIGKYAAGALVKSASPPATADSSMYPARPPRHQIRPDRADTVINGASRAST